MQSSKCNLLHHSNCYTVLLGWSIFIGTCGHTDQRPEILAPLTAHTGAPKKGEQQSPFVWTSEMWKAFGQMKALMAADVLCAYPSLSHFNGVQFCGSTTTCNTLDTHILKRQCKLRCSGRVRELPSGQ
jgi:hypothetical protein